MLAGDAEPDEPRRADGGAAAGPRSDADGLEGARHGSFPRIRAPFYDRFGNVGPTVWWGGETVGGWAIRPDGRIATRLVVDRGADAEQAVAEAADALEARLGGAAVVPAFPTPLEKELRTG